MPSVMGHASVFSATIRKAVSASEVSLSLSHISLLFLLNMQLFTSDILKIHFPFLTIDHMYKITYRFNYKYILLQTLKQKFLITNLVT